MTAALLSLCCPLGLAQFMLGQHAKGALIFLISAFIGAGTLGVGAYALGVVIAMDAYAIASKLQQGRSVGQWEFF
jgi:TM2 domain-containing membrane protein YozV